MNLLSFNVAHDPVELKLARWRHRENLFSFYFLLFCFVFRKTSSPRINLSSLVLKTISEIRPRKTCDWMYQFSTQYNDWRLPLDVSFSQADFLFSLSQLFGFVSLTRLAVAEHGQRKQPKWQQTRSLLWEILSRFFGTEHIYKVASTTTTRSRWRQCLLLFIIKHQFLVKNKTILLITTLAAESSRAEPFDFCCMCDERFFCRVFEVKTINNLYSCLLIFINQAGEKRSPSSLLLLLSSSSHTKLYFRIFDLKHSFFSSSDSIRRVKATKL